MNNIDMNIPTYAVKLHISESTTNPLLKVVKFFSQVLFLKAF